MKFSTAVLTAPRPNCLLGQTIDSLVEAGWSASELVIHDGSPPLGHTPSPKWCTEAYRTLFRGALDRWTDEEGLLVFEDDVAVCLGLKEYLERIPWPEDIRGIAMVTPYCPTAYSNYGDFDKWHREDQRDTIAGTQSFIYTRRAVEMFVRQLDPDMPHEFHKDAYAGVDVQVGQIAKRANMHIWYHIPSLVQHVGICNSAVGFTTDLGTIYSAETFPGTRFDARGLS